MPTADNEPLQANSFELTGEHRRITYDRTTFTGQPQLTYHDDKQPDLDGTFTGDEIRSLDSEDTGSMVSVTLRARPDLDTLNLTLLVPDVNLQDGAARSISTLAILITHHTTIGGPNLVEGPLQTYEVVALEGTARFVTP
jgi:hypothetical protein